MKNDKVKRRIERGSVVRLTQCQDCAFLVFAVWKQLGNKWFLSSHGDDPEWHVGIVNKKYRIGARKVKVTGEKEIQYVSSESSVAEGIVEQHGTQDCACYRMVQLNEIIYLYGKVDV